jgi:hypothetical protein
MLPVDYIGTDPGTASNIADHRFDLTALQWDPAELAKLNVELHQTPTEPLDLSQMSVAKGWPTSPRSSKTTPIARPVSPRRATEMDGFGLPIGVRELRAYKARPLAGWATPPFLHNGSVPTIYQLLSPQDERSTTFYKGTFEYDPKHLGLRRSVHQWLCVRHQNHRQPQQRPRIPCRQAWQWRHRPSACCHRSAGRCWNTSKCWAALWSNNCHDFPI